LGAAVVGRAAAFATGITGTPGPGPEALAREVVATMTRKKLVLSAVAAVVLGGGLAGLTAAGPGADGPTGTGGPNRYAVHSAGGSALLLDAATGDTWVLNQAGKEPTWVPVRRPARPTESAQPTPLKDKDSAPPKPAPPGQPVALEIAGRLALAQAYRVHPRAAGIVVQVRVRSGEAVKAGQILVELDSTDARLALEGAEAGLALAEASVPPRTAGVATVQEVKRAEAEVRRARVEVEKARAAIAATRLLAPADGAVVELGVAPGDAVAPGGAAVAVVGSLDRLAAETDVPESAVARVAVGQGCAVRVGPGGPEYPGVVAEVAPVVDPRTATVRVRVAVKIPDREPPPRPGSFVTVRFSEKK
jgi:multidrug efflux pump subunit AcrA (membrane-fusion protein)